MTWFRVDDTLHAHGKPRKAGLEAMGLWTVAGSYCGQQATGGFVPSWFIEGWPKGKTLAKKLVDAGLWVVGTNDDEHGWWFHEWTQSNPSRAQVLATRQAAKERQAKWKKAKADAIRAANAAADASVDEEGAA